MTVQCHSKFGEVVFSLTRFFRDGRIHGPTKPEMMLLDDKGKVKLVKENHITLFWLIVVLSCLYVVMPFCLDQLMYTRAVLYSVGVVLG